ncbi:MAG: hypothetical protein J1F38_01590 [Muribaculaceae bacterium]|nr:hypothetical protein [Muribaculaceae bacterium]
MKKLMSLMLCIGATTAMFAQVTLVKQAEKLSGKPDKLEEARGLIKQAMANPETKDQAYTYYVAGKIELDAYDNGYKTRMINPGDASASVDALGQELLGFYNYALQALPLDSLPNEKGQVKPKYSKDLINKIKGHQSDFYSVGADYYNEQKFYPEAYDAFMIYASLPEKFLGPNNGLITPEQAAAAFFNAGLAANQGGNIDASAEAFKQARLMGYDKPEATIFEIACWQTIAQNDNDRANETMARIKDAAQFGLDNFGMENPIFLNNLINVLVNDNQSDEALAKLNDLIAANPDVANLYGLRGYIYDRLENDDASVADFRKAASLPTVDFETLKNASNKLYRVGTSKLNSLEGNSPEINAAREDVKNNYFLQAQKYAEQANLLQPGDPYIQNILDSIDYAITTFFN